MKRQNKEQKMIGILGGMGPDASAELYRYMIQQARDRYGAQENHEYPEIRLYSIPVRDFFSDTGDKAQALALLRQRVQELNSVPPACVGIACNTAHIFLRELREETSAPFVSILDEVEEQIQSRGIQCVGLLASPTTICSGLYQRQLAASGLHMLVPSEKDTRQLGELIRHIISGKTAVAEKSVIRMVGALVNKGAEGIILGCTELSLLNLEDNDILLFDSLKILGDALLKHYYERG